jgi:hypothetical protein
MLNHVKRRAYVLLIVLCVVAALVLIAVSRPFPAIVGGGRPPPPHVVVDTLNLAHHIRLPVKPRRALAMSDVIGAIDTTAPLLRAKFPGRVMYVVKDREQTDNGPTARDAYADAAKRNQVYVYVVERYTDDARVRKRQPHAARARDDLFMALLARRWNCPVLTEDKFKDFGEFRSEVPPFHTYEYTYFGTHPSRDYIRPANSAYSKLKKPYSIRYASVNIVPGYVSTSSSSPSPSSPSPSSSSSR